MQSHGHSNTRAHEGIDLQKAPSLELSQDMEREVPGLGRGDLWSGNNTVEQQPREDGRKNQDQWPLPSGRERTSGGRCPDGRDQRTNRSISVDPRLRFDKAITPGGYQWWYIDSISDDGDFALTVIAFVGHVFSPHYYRARQKSSSTLPLAERYCAMNLGLHALTPRGMSRLGCKMLWSLNEFSHPDSESWQDGVEREPHRLLLGQSSLSYTEAGLSAKLSERTKPFFQRMPKRIEGELSLHFQSPSEHVISLDSSGEHHWMGVAPHARIDVSLDEPDLSFSGHAYHDSNWGIAPLESAFHSWTWSRATLDEGTLVMYDVTESTDSTPQERAALFRANGEVVELDQFDRAKLKSGLWGIERSTRTDAYQSASIKHRLVDSPFYTRDVIKTTLMGQNVLAVHESLDLVRFQKSWVRFLIPFRIRRI